MTHQSWIHLTDEAQATRLPEALKRRDRVAAIDRGWVEQIRLFLTLFSQPGELVYDPFAGFGTTLVACALEGRRGLGVEIDPERVDLARTWLADVESRTQQEVLLADARNAPLDPDSVDLCLTNLPYFGSRLVGGGPQHAQAYVIEHYADYLAFLDSVFAQLARVLRPGGRLVALLENVVLANGRFVPQAWDAARLIGGRLELEEERILCYDHKQPQEGTQTSRAHEYALIACKRRRPMDLEAARCLLLQLLAGGLSFTVIGSMGLVLLGDAPRHPADVDLLLPASPQQLDLFASLVRGLGFQVMSWGEPVTAPLDHEKLQGRFYLRARRLEKDGAELMVDATYECPWLPFDEASEHQLKCRGIPVASKHHITRLMKVRDGSL